MYEKIVLKTSRQVYILLFIVFLPKGRYTTHMFVVNTILLKKRTSIICTTTYKVKRNVCTIIFINNGITCILLTNVPTPGRLKVSDVALYVVVHSSNIEIGTFFRAF